MNSESEQSIPSRGSGANYSAFPNSWIPVTERLPDEDQLVLVFDPELADLGLATYTKSDGWLGECVALYEPTHWMPLPAPPTDGK
jgi:hypothetical protein